MTSDGSAPEVLTDTPKRRGFWVGVGMILVVAAAARFWGLSERELWFDENCTFYIVHHLYAWPPDGPDPWREVAHLPYFLLLHAWTCLAGETAWGMRSFSAFVGCIGVVLMGLVGRHLGGRSVGLISASLTALHPLHLHYSHEARGYTPWLLGMTVCVYLLSKAGRSSRVRWWVGYGVALWLTVLTHYYTLLWLLGTPAAVLLARDHRRFWREWLITHAALAVALAPVVWLVVLPFSAGGAKPWFREMWFGYPPALAILESLWAMLPSGGYPSYLGTLGMAGETASTRVGVGFGYLARWGPAILLGGLVLLAGLSTIRRGRPLRADHKRVLMLMLSLSLVYLLASWLYSWLIEPTYIVGRYDLAAWPSLVLAMAILVDSGARRLATPGAVRNAVRVLFTALLVGCSLITIIAARAVPVRNDLTVRARRIAAVVGPDDLVISLGKYRLFVAYEWHRLEFSAEVVSFPRNHDRQLCWSDAEAELANPAQIEADATEVTDLVLRAMEIGRRVWLLAHGEPKGARWEVDQQLFARLRRLGIDVRPHDEDLGLVELIAIRASSSDDDWERH